MDDLGNIYANARLEHEDEEPPVDTWQELHWPHPYDRTFDSMPLIAEQENLPFDLLPCIKLKTQSLGKGGFGVVYRCSLTLPHRRLKNYVIKLPKTFMNAGKYEIVDGGYIRDTGTAVSAATEDAAKNNFETEMVWFEKIYEPHTFWTRFGGGMRGNGIQLPELLAMQAADMQLARHPGRQHIHRYVHFDLEIPAIFSEVCDGTLHDLREHHRDWFISQSPQQMAPAWLTVGMQLASGVGYMLQQNVAHCDIKPANILYQLRAAAFPNEPESARLVCKISDFGICHDTAAMRFVKPGGTTYYQPPSWPNGQGMFMSSMTVFNVMCTMAELLAGEHVPDWPYTMAWQGRGSSMVADCNTLCRARNVDTKAFGDAFFPFPLANAAEYDARNGAWGPVAFILNSNFAHMVGHEYGGYVSRMGSQCEEALRPPLDGGLGMFDAAMMPPMAYDDGPPGGWGDGMMDPVDMADIDGFYAN